jgi:cytoskeletal protein CcmA (bactofilin family)
MSHRIALLLSCLALAGHAAAEEAHPSPSTWIGGSVGITQATEDPVLAVGGTVTVNAPVNGNVRMAGGTVEVGSAAAISGDAALAGGSITVEGSIKGNLHAAGGQVRINGPVAGDASIAAGTLELGPDARIDGKLVFRGEELRRDPAAQVTGGVEHRQGRTRLHARTTAERFTHGWIWSAGLMVLAALIAAALPGASRRMAQELRERPWITPLLGFVALTSIPIAAVLVMITVIGIPVGLLALIGYAALLLVGYVWVAVVVGGMLLDRVRPETAALTAWRAGAAVLAMLALAVLVRMPFVGHLVGLAALVVGVGMIVAVVFRHSQGAEAAAG